MCMVWKGDHGILMTRGEAPCSDCPFEVFPIFHHRLIADCGSSHVVATATNASIWDPLGSFCWLGCWLELDYMIDETFLLRGNSMTRRRRKV